MVPIKKIEDLISKHALLETELSTGKVDKKLFAEKSKEYSDLNEIIKEAKEYQSFEKDKVELNKIINDTTSESDMKSMAETELEKIVSFPQILHQAIIIIFPKLKWKKYMI